MINKFVSSKAVIAKVIADLGLDENDIKITDISQWIGEAMQKIGAVTQLDHKVQILKIKDYQVALPCDLEKIDFVAYSNCNCNGWIPMKKSTGFFTIHDKIDNCEECKMLFQDTVLFPLVKSMFNINTDAEALEILNKEDNLRCTLSALLNTNTTCNTTGNNTTNFSITPQYIIKPGYLMSNVRNGYIKISYYGIYTDDEGMPMIPDEPSYFEALYWYVAMKLLYIEYFTGRKSQGLYYDAKNSWNFYRKQAYAEAMMPDQNDLINISKTWHTIVPEIDSYDTFLSTTGDSQVIKNQNSIWK